MTSPASASTSLGRATADRLAAAIRSVRGVADLHAGRYGEVATLFPRHRVNGLRRTPGELEVHLVVDLDAGRPLYEIAAEVRGVVTQLLDTPVTICFADARQGTTS